MNTSLEGFANQVATLKCNSTVTQAGQLVKIAASGTVGKCTSGEVPVGVTVNVRNGYAGVLMKGYTNVKHDGTVTAGYRKISASDDQTVKLDDTNGIGVIVVDIDGDKAGIIL